MGLSVALGVIAGKCGSLRLVLAGPAGCLRGRWRSGPRKWRHAAGSRARVSKHRAPVGALRLCDEKNSDDAAPVSKHRAPVGALRLSLHSQLLRRQSQQAPCTCRCIKTRDQTPTSTSHRRQQAPRTCRCIKTTSARAIPAHSRGQQAPRTCRCIKTVYTMAYT